MRRLVSCLVAAFAAFTLASCKDVPSERFECTCHAANVSADNSRSYVLCESDKSEVHGDAMSQCESAFGADAGCECTCTRAGDC